MNRKQYYAAHRLIRENWRMGFRFLLPDQKKVMTRVFDLRRPCLDRLYNRQWRAVTFAMYGDHAPKPLINEYAMAGKIAFATWLEVA